MMAQISVIIPAHNEEKYIERCIKSIQESEEEFGGSVEIIVVCNRCTDRETEFFTKCSTYSRSCLNNNVFFFVVDSFYNLRNIVLFIECTNRARNDTLTTEDATNIFDFFFKCRSNVCFETSFYATDNRDCLFVTSSYATTAKYTFVVVSNK